VKGEKRKVLIGVLVTVGGQRPKTLRRTGWGHQGRPDSRGAMGGLAKDKSHANASYPGYDATTIPTGRTGPKRLHMVATREKKPAPHIHKPIKIKGGGDT